MGSDLPPTYQQIYYTLQSSRMLVSMIWEVNTPQLGTIKPVRSSGGEGSELGNNTFTLLKLQSFYFIGITPLKNVSCPSLVCY